MSADPPRAAHAGVDCVHADDTLLVLDKPAGLLCVPGRGPDKQDSLSMRAQALWPDALIVHRICRWRWPRAMSPRRSSRRRWPKAHAR